MMMDHKIFKLFYRCKRQVTASIALEKRNLLAEMVIFLGNGGSFSLPVFITVWRYSACLSLSLSDLIIFN